MTKFKCLAYSFSWAKIITEFSNSIKNSVTDKNHLRFCNIFLKECFVVIVMVVAMTFSSPFRFTKFFHAWRNWKNGKLRAKKFDYSKEEHTTQNKLAEYHNDTSFAWHEQRATEFVYLVSRKNSFLLRIHGLMHTLIEITALPNWPNKALASFPDGSLASQKQSSLLLLQAPNSRLVIKGYNIYKLYILQRICLHYNKSRTT